VTKTSSHAIVEGVQMTLKEIYKVLERFHLKSLESEGKPFDPNFHQAVLQEETSEHPENTVLKEMQKGYVLHDRLIRPAMVVVSKALPKNDDSPASAD
jgi:molecular chaperone GrpE